MLDTKLYVHEFLAAANLLMPELNVRSVAQSVKPARMVYYPILVSVGGVKAAEG